MSLTPEQAKRAMEKGTELLGSFNNMVPAEILAGPHGAEAVAGFLIGNVATLVVILEDVSTLATTMSFNHRARFEELEKHIVALTDRVQHLEGLLNGPQS